MGYRVQPGLYALGAPGRGSPVCVTANYKMSFDRLRKALKDRSAWILVLDTRGINVWCAAGKGTFGTDELTERIQSSRLADLLDHRQVIVPQLGAPGVAAHRVHRRTGFKVVFGPVLAEDLGAFLDAGFRASPQMRTRYFPLRERLALIPMELVGAFQWLWVPILALAGLGGFGGTDSFAVGAFSNGLFIGAALLTGLLGGAVVTPILLPWIPGRAFSTKGVIVGVLCAVAFLGASGRGWASGVSRLESLAAFFLIVASACYLSMNFTGSSTFTSLSGVRREMRWAAPLQGLLAGLGVGLWILARVLA